MPAFRSFDGVVVHYTVRGEGGTVVMLHGFASDGESNWVDTGIADAVADAGHEVVVVDARGHGRSAKPHDDASYRPPAMARDVVELLDHLGAETAHLVGYSMGATTAITAASIDDRIDRLVLGGAGATLLRANDEPMRRRRLLGAAVLGVDDPGSLTDPAAIQLRAFVDKGGGDRRALAAVLRTEEGLSEEALRITNPTLVMAGRSDAGAGAPDALAAVLANAEAAFVEGDHLGAVRDPRFVERAVGFLAP